MTTFNQQTYRIIKAALSRLAYISCALTLLCSFTLCPTSARADTVELNNGDTLTGTIQTLEQGLVLLQSPVANTPLKIKAAAVRKISFPEAATDHPHHTESLTLANNDVLPCDVISMDGKQLHISTWYAGKFSIPRINIRKLQFGITQEKNIFLGNLPPSQWTSQNGKWSHSGTSYTSAGIGTLAQELELPENARFTFNLSWEKTPNFVFRFCAENDSDTTKQGTYELSFNSAGMQIRRYQDGNTTEPSALIETITEIKPHTLPNQSVDIDLRVDRREGFISLYIDTKLIGTWSDPFDAPKGNHIIFNNRSKETKSCILSSISVAALNEDVLPRYREKTSTTATDVLIDSEGEKISGVLKSISEAETNKRTIVFAFKHSSEPLLVPDRRISTLLFAKPGSAPKFGKPTYVATLIGAGQIHLDNPKLVDGKITSIHPILGPCILSPESISHITQGNANPDTQSSASP